MKKRLLQVSLATVGMFICSPNALADEVEEQDQNVFTSSSVDETQVIQSNGETTEYVSDTNFIQEETVDITVDSAIENPIQEDFQIESMFVSMEWNSESVVWDKEEWDEDYKLSEEENYTTLFAKTEDVLQSYNYKYVDGLELYPDSSVGSDTSIRANIYSQADLDTYLRLTGTDLSLDRLVFLNQDKITFPNNTYTISSGSATWLFPEGYLGDIDFGESVFLLNPDNQKGTLEILSVFTGDQGGRIITGGTFRGQQNYIRGNDGNISQASNGNAVRDTTGAVRFKLLKASNITFDSMAFEISQADNSHIFDIMGSHDVTIKESTFAGHPLGQLNQNDLSYIVSARAHSLYTEAIQIDHAVLGAYGWTEETFQNAKNRNYYETRFQELSDFDGAISYDIYILGNQFTPYVGLDSTGTEVNFTSSSGVGAHSNNAWGYVTIYGNTFDSPAYTSDNRDWVRHTASPIHFIFGSSADVKLTSEELANSVFKNKMLDTMSIVGNTFTNLPNYSYPSIGTSRDVAGIYDNVKSAEILLYVTIYQPNETLEYGVKRILSEGQNGYYLEDHKGVRLEETNPVPQIVEVGTKSTEEIVVLDYSTQYKANKESDYGIRTTLQEGKNGSKTVTTSYFLDSETGVVTPTTETSVVEPIIQIIEIGIKPTVMVSNIDYQTQYKANLTSDYGTETILQEGKNGTKTVTTTYILNTETGEVTSTTETSIVDPISQIVEVGIKPTEKTETIARGTDFIEDSNSLVGDDKFIDGEDGIRTTKIIYILNTETGEMTEIVNVIETAPSNNKEIVGVANILAYSTQYIGDKSLPYGTRITEQKGEDGRIHVNGEIIQNPVQEIIRVGLQKEVIILEEAHSIAPNESNSDYVELETLPIGREVIATAPVSPTVTQVTTYTLDEETGVVNSITEIIKDGLVRGVVHIGSGENQYFPYKTIYISDYDRNAGDRFLVKEGVARVINVLGEVVIEGSDEVISVGTKEEVVKDTIPFETITVDSSNLFVGESQLLTKGVDGVKTVIYSYSLAEDGTVIEHINETIEKPVSEIILVGARVASIEESDQINVISENHNLITSGSNGEIISSANTDNDGEVSFTNNQVTELKLNKSELLGQISNSKLPNTGERNKNSIISGTSSLLVALLGFRRKRKILLTK